MASANAQIGVAKSAYYPLINLGASGGFESSSITTLLTRSKRAMVVGSFCSGDRF